MFAKLIRGSSFYDVTRLWIFFDTTPHCDAFSDEALLLSSQNPKPPLPMVVTSFMKDPFAETKKFARKYAKIVSQKFYSLPIEGFKKFNTKCLFIMITLNLK